MLPHTSSVSSKWNPGLNLLQVSNLTCFRPHFNSCCLLLLGWVYMLRFISLVSTSLFQHQRQSGPIEAWKLCRRDRLKTRRQGSKAGLHKTMKSCVSFNHRQLLWGPVLCLVTRLGCCSHESSMLYHRPHFLLQVYSQGHTLWCGE